MRGVSQTFEPVVVLGEGRVAGRYQVDERDLPAAGADPTHLLDGFLRVPHVMQRETRHDDVEAPRRMGQALGLAALEADVRDAFLAGPRHVPSASMAGVRSRATTRPARRATARLRWPVPAATSSTTAGEPRSKLSTIHSR